MRFEAHCHPKLAPPHPLKNDCCISVLIQYYPIDFLGHTWLCVISYILYLLLKFEEEDGKPFSLYGFHSLGLLFFILLLLLQYFIGYCMRNSCFCFNVFFCFYLNLSCVCSFFEYLRIIQIGLRIFFNRSQLINKIIA